MSYGNLDELLKIQNNNAPSIITLLPDDNVYEINLNTRQIDPLETVIVRTDHRAETIYFKINRFFDNVDLARMSCIIQYETADKKQRVYAVPFYDIDTYSNGDKEACTEDPMILFPWIISEDVTSKEGILTFSIRFYSVDQIGGYFTYSISTLPSQVEIKQDINFQYDKIHTEEEYDYLATNYLALLSNATQAALEGSLTWIVL